MLPILEFYGNHALDFANNDIGSLEHYAISELRKFALPEEIRQIVHDKLSVQFPGGELSKFESMENWSPVSFPTTPGVRDFPKKNIVSLGPLGIRIVFTSEYIILPSLINERVDWYSPNYKDKVQIIRSYYYTIINHFGGDHALYIEDRISNKYYSCKNTLNSFEQELVARYGTSKKSLFDYPHGKFPKYYIDHFTDMK
ncbi:MAG: hypothetical protein LBH44_11820 [Treponema sp.]|jgi:hypothetical protein|nr:hypothetical protein [Treponema sp.]